MKLIGSLLRKKAIVLKVLDITNNNIGQTGFCTFCSLYSHGKCKSLNLLNVSSMFLYFLCFF